MVEIARVTIATRLDTSKITDDLEELSRKRALAKIAIPVSLDTTQFKEGIDKLIKLQGGVKIGEKLGDDVGKGFSAKQAVLSGIITGVMGGIAVSLTNMFANAIGGGIQAGIGFLTTSVAKGSEIQQLRIAFETLTGSASQAQKTISGLIEFAATTPFEMPEVQQAGRSLLSFGFEATKLEDTLRSVGDVAAGLSIPLNELTQIYGKIKVQGRVFGEDMNQLAGRGVPVFEEMAKVIGVSGDKVRELVSAGKVGFPQIEQVFKNLTGAGGKFNNLMAEQAKSVSGLYSNLRDNFTKIQVALFDSIEPALSSALQFTNAIFEELDDGVGIFDGLNNQAVRFSDYLADNPQIAEEIGLALKEGVEASLEVAADLAKDLLDTLRENPQALADMVKSLAEFVKLLTDGVAAISKIVGGIMQMNEGINQFFDNLPGPDWFKTLAQWGPAGLIIGDPTGRGGGGGGGGTSPQDNANTYFRRLAYLESGGDPQAQNPNSTARGAFQFIAGTRQEAIRQGHGDPWQGGLEEQQRVASRWLQSNHPEAWRAIANGNFDLADQLLRTTWTSLPGAAEAQSSERQRAAWSWARGTTGVGGRGALAGAGAAAGYAITNPALQNFGAPRDGGSREHAGQDFDITGEAAPAVSFLGGTVHNVGYDPGGYGHYVDIYNAERAVTERIAEFSEVLVKVGDSIQQGQEVGRGESRTGVLHYEIRTSEGNIDPLEYYRSIGVDPLASIQNLRPYTLEQQDRFDQEQFEQQQRETGEKKTRGIEADFEQRREIVRRNQEIEDSTRSLQEAVEELGFTYGDDTPYNSYLSTVDDISDSFDAVITDINEQIAAQQELIRIQGATEESTARLNALTDMASSVGEQRVNTLRSEAEAYLVLQKEQVRLAESQEEQRLREFNTESVGLDIGILSQRAEYEREYGDAVRASRFEVEAAVMSESLRFQEQIAGYIDLQNEGALTEAQMSQLIGQATELNQVNLDSINASFVSLGETIARQVEPMFTNFFTSIILGTSSAEEALLNLLGSLADMLLQMALQPLLSGLFGSLFGGGLGLTGGIGGFGSSVGGALGGALFAQGGIVPGGFLPIKAFASGGIIKRPTLGLVGEGGSPEAIVPLQGGAIPVRMSGDRESAKNITINVEINNQGQARTTGDQADRLGKQLKNAVVGILLDQRRPGGVLYS